MPEHESVEEILAAFEEGGLVFKWFDYKKQDYVYAYTALGRAMRKFMDGHGGQLPKTKKFHLVKKQKSKSVI